MEKNYCDLPQELTNTDYLAVVEPEIEKKNFLDMMFAMLDKHPGIVLFGVIVSGLILTSVIVYFSMSKNSENTSLDNTISPIVATNKSKIKARPVFDGLDDGSANPDMADAGSDSESSLLTATKPSKVVAAQKVMANITLAPTVLPTQTTTTDTQPPFSVIMSPQSMGTITSKHEDKICALISPPSDNTTPPEEIEVIYAFDTDPYTTAKNVIYLCRDLLANGQHTLKYKSRDQAGNEEKEKSLSFNVNIPGN